MLRFLARLVAVCCALVFVLATIGVIFFQAAGTRFLQAPIYQRALAREHFYERVPTLSAELAVHASRYRTRVAGPARDALDQLAQLTAADWERLLGILTPASWLQAQGDRALDRLAASLHAETGPLSAGISLGELKERLASPAAEEAFLAILRQRPEATPEQIQEAGGVPEGLRPPDAMMPQLRDKFRSAVRGLVDYLPDTFDPFAAGLDPGWGRAVNALIDERDTLVAIEWWARWSPALPVALLLLVALFGVRSLRGALLWCGIPCLLAGAGAALLALPVVPAARWAFSVLVEPLFPVAVPSGLIDATFGVMTAVVQEIMNAALLPAAWLAGAGLLCVVLAWFVRRKPAAGAPAPG